MHTTPFPFFPSTTLHDCNTQAIQVVADRFKSDIEKDSKLSVNISMLAADDKVFFFLRHLCA